MKHRFVDDSRVSILDSVPPMFGFGILASKISGGKVTVTTLLTNRTTRDISVVWHNSHIYLVTITDRHGRVFRVNDYLGPPLEQAPTIVLAGLDHTYVFNFDHDDSLYQDAFKFDPSNSPYRFEFVTNSPSHHFSATVTLDLSAATADDGGHPSGVSELDDVQPTPCGGACRVKRTVVGGKTFVECESDPRRPCPQDGDDDCHCMLFRCLKTELDQAEAQAMANFWERVDGDREEDNQDYAYGCWCMKE